MKRIGYLMPQIADYNNLCLAFVKATRGKQCKMEVIRFRQDLETNISAIKHALEYGETMVGKYHSFTIKDPKERVICAATLQERIIHHAIMNVCHDYFDKRLIDDTYATRKGKGVYAALDKARRSLARYRFVAKLDFRKYYDSIDHEVLKLQLRRMFKDRNLLRLLDEIISCYEVTPGKGLPIGNLTSQYFANTYLSELDHYAKEKLRIPLYIRYMDDILIADNDMQVLKDYVQKLNEYSANLLRLQLKPPIYKDTYKGIVFLGYKIYPYRLDLSGRSKRRYRSKQLKYYKLFKDGEWGEQTYNEHLIPLCAFAKHAYCKTFMMDCLNILHISGDD